MRPPALETIFCATTTTSPSADVNPSAWAALAIRAGRSSPGRIAVSGQRPEPHVPHGHKTAPRSGRRSPDMSPRTHAAALPFRRCPALRAPPMASSNARSTVSQKTCRAGSGLPSADRSALVHVHDYPERTAFFAPMARCSLSRREPGLGAPPVPRGIPMQAARRQYHGNGLRSPS